MRSLTWCPGRHGGSCTPAALLPERSCHAVQQPEPVPEECKALGTCCVHLGSLAGKTWFGFKLPVPA